MKVAVIGLGCRFPGSSNTPDEFFDNLVSKKDCVSEIPDNRWNKDFFYDKEKGTPGKINSKKGGFMDNIFNFDHEAFSMSVKESSNIDPQQKILLETTLQALEDSKLEYRGSKTGVFIGTGQVDFSDFSLSKLEYVNEYTAHGSALSIHSNMLSYKFDLQGPSLSVDTACSSSGTAMYLATRALESGDCEQAVVGGINMILNHGMSVAFSKLGVLSPDGICRSFDKDANGYVRSEGCGVVVIKPLEKAIQDNDKIYSVIISTTCNEDGARSPSLTMPSSEAQRQVMETSIKKSKIDPKKLFYIEAHATGTPVGDPIEMNTIGSVFGINRTDSLKMGSVKSNIGHCECSSYIASLIKVSMMMQKGLLLPSINFKTPNPKIKFEEYKLSVQTEVEKFDPKDKLFAISSFGFGGSNICTLLEGFEQKVERKETWKLQSTPNVYIVKAQSETALKERVKLMQEKFASEDQHKTMFTLNSSYQDIYRYMSFGLGKNIKEAKFSEPIRTSDDNKPICFVFSGQGPQNINMGRTLYSKFPCFKSTIDECDAIYEKASGISLLKDIGVFGSKIGQEKDVQQIHITLPALIFLQIGLYKLWINFGLKPDVIIGHSFGEMCATYASGSCSLEEVLTITAKRAKLMSNFDNLGTMMAVGISASEVTEIIKKLEIKQLWIAAINSPVSCTLGGIVESVHKMAKFCDEKKIFNRVLSVTNAYHTPLLSSLREKAITEFEGSIVSSTVPKVKVISTVTGDFWETAFDADYFWQNVEKGVLFQQAIELAMKTFGNETVFLEMAAHPVLSISMKQTGATNILSSMNRKEDEQTTLFKTIAHLSSQKFDLNWKQIIGEDEKLSIPPYPFQRKTCFAETEQHKNSRFIPEGTTGILGNLSDNSRKTWKNLLNTKTHPFLKDHIVQQTTIFPGAGYVELALEALGKNLQNIQILSALMIPTDSSFVGVEVTIEDGIASIFSKKENDSNWTLHAKATLKNNAILIEDLKLNTEEISKRCSKKLNKESVYRRFDVMGLSYGSNFQCIESLEQGDEESLGFLSTKHLDLNKWILHPSVLDCAFQCFLGAIQNCAKTYLPIGIDELSVFEKTPEEFLTYCEITNLTEKTVKGDITAIDKSGKLLFKVVGFTASAIPQPKSNTKEISYTPHWQTKKLPDVVFKKESIPLVNHFLIKSLLEETPKMEQNIIIYLEQTLKSIDESKLTLNAKKYFNWCSEFLKKSKSKIHFSEVSPPTTSEIKRKSSNPIEPEKVEIKRKTSNPKDGHEVKRNSNGVQEIARKNSATKEKPVLKETEDFKLENEMIKKIGDNLKNILTMDDESVNEFISSDNALEKLFENSLTFKPTSDVILNLFQKTLDTFEETRVFRVLQLAHGSTSLTTQLLSILKNYKGRVEFYFADSSKSCEEAEKKFQEYSFIQYKVIDVQKSFESQGIPRSSIDIVIGFNTIDSTVKNTKILSNISKSLVPNGLLIVAEHTTRSNVLNFVFGALNNWSFEGTIESQISASGFEQEEIYTVEKHLHSVFVARRKMQIDDVAVDFTVFQDQDPLMLLEYIKANHVEKKPLLIISKGAQIKVESPEHASLVGMTRVIANENLDWNIKTLDISNDTKNVEEWIERVKQFSNEFEVENAIQGDKLLVPRFLAIKKEPKTNSEIKTPFRLESDKPGLLNSLIHHQFEFPTLKEDEIIAQVKSSALNFKDIMLAMNMLDSFEMDLGLEFSGVITQKGSNVKYEIGDEIFGFSSHSFASHVVTSQFLIVKKPKNISFEEAASIPAVFVTPYFALVYKANVQEGDKVLIHSAAGGVGQSAIQLVKWLKGDIYATVGSQEKRNFLKEKYGVERFGNSRTTEWDQEILSHEPKGVDVVLNSLSGENITKGINILSPYGSFIEIGKRDILDNNSIALKPFLHNLSYYSVHLDQMFNQKPKLVGKLLKEIADLFEQNILTPIVDKIFPSFEIVEAFRYMQSGKHMGKIMINYEEKNYPKEIATQTNLFSAEKTYVLSGGLGAVGFEIMKWMISQGAKFLVLLSRRGNLTKYQSRELQSLKANIFISKTDVCDETDVVKCYKEIEMKNYPKIGGVIHLAMVLDDDNILKLTKERFSNVYEPKVQGAKNLMKPLNPKDLDFVLFFSSISSIIGNPEQSNYAAANCFLDNYAHHLSTLGFPAYALNLGAVDDVGVIANDFQLRKIMKLRGISNENLTVQEIFKIIDSILRSKTVQHLPSLDLISLCKNYPLMAQKCGHLVERVYVKVGNENKQELNVEALKVLIGGLLQVEPSDINEKEKLTTYGVDSLLAVEISSLLDTKFDIKVSQMDILSGASVASLIKK
eukprot:gene4960-8554_t